MYKDYKDCWKEIESSKGGYNVYSFRAVLEGEEIVGWEVYRLNEAEQAEARRITNALYGQALSQNTPSCPYNQRIG